MSILYLPRSSKNGNERHTTPGLLATTLNFVTRATAAKAKVENAFSENYEKRGWSLSASGMLRAIRKNPREQKQTSMNLEAKEREWGTSLRII